MEPSTQNGTGAPTSVSQLPPEAVALAGRMFEAARKGDETSVALLTQALQRGLPANLTNHKGDSLVSHTRILAHETNVFTQATRNTGICMDLSTYSQTYQANMVRQSDNARLVPWPRQSRQALTST